MALVTFTASPRGTKERSSVRFDNVQNKVGLKIFYLSLLFPIYLCFSLLSLFSSIYLYSLLISCFSLSFSSVFYASLYSKILLFLLE